MPSKVFFINIKLLKMITALRFYQKDEYLEIIEADEKGLVSILCGSIDDEQNVVGVTLEKEDLIILKKWVAEQIKKLS